jgi:hypothetical protein
MIWGWAMPASLWYFSGSVLALINGVDLTEQTLPYFNETLQGAIFLVLQHFLSIAINKSFELFEIFDLNERHGMKSMTFGLYLMEKLKSTLIFMVLGLPAFWLFMWLIDIVGNIFFIFLLLLTAEILFNYKYIYLYLIAPLYNNFEELPEDLPGFPNLKEEIFEMAVK